MKRILISVITTLLLSATAFAGNNDIYITQTGTGLTLTVDQIGSGNTLAASILQGNSTSWTYSATGGSNTATFAVGATGDVAGSDFDWTQSSGDSNVLLWTQGDSATATGANTDFIIVGASNNINARCNVVGCINNWDITGNTNDIDTVQTGSANHAITVDLTGSSMDIDIDQTDATSTNVANLILVSSGGSGSSINIDQCASGC
jgi:hypothetical protein